MFYSLDWHPSDHISFIDNIKTRALHESSPLDADSAQVFDTVVFEGPPTIKQRLWPRHCVQDSWGSELHKDLKIVENSVKVYKGKHRNSVCNVERCGSFYWKMKKKNHFLWMDLFKPHWNLFQFNKFKIFDPFKSWIIHCPALFRCMWRHKSRDWFVFSVLGQCKNVGNNTQCTVENEGNHRYLCVRFGIRCKIDFPLCFSFENPKLLLF